MRGDAERQANMLLAVTPDSFIPDDHPIRRIKPLVERVLARLSPLFDAMYAERGRPSIPPEHLLKASLLIALYSIRSERQFCERLRYDLLFKWFLDLNVSDEPFDASSFSKNRDRLLEHGLPRLLRGGGGRGAAAPAALRRPLHRGRPRCWRPGPRSRATTRATSRTRPVAPLAGATGRSTSAGSGAAARRTSPAPTRRRSCTRRGRGRRRSSATWAICSPRTATAWCWTWS